MRFAVFENVDRAPEIMFEQLARAGLAVHTREHARIGGGIDYEVRLGKRFKIRGAADVCVNNFHTELGEFAAIEFAARADEVVYAGNFQIFFCRQQGPRERAAHETADAGDQNLHLLG